MNIPYLHTLADFLDDLPSDRYNHDYWASDPSLHLNVCGTTACALGWATTIPEFGLKLVEHTSGHSSWITVDLQEGGAKSSMEAAQIAFGLTNDQAHQIFGDAYVQDWETTPSDVASRIRLMVRAEETRLARLGKQSQ